MKKEGFEPGSKGSFLDHEGVTLGFCSGLTPEPPKAPGQSPDKSNPILLQKAIRPGPPKPPMDTVSQSHSITSKQARRPVPPKSPGGKIMEGLCYNSVQPRDTGESSEARQHPPVRLVDNHSWKLPQRRSSRHVAKRIYQIYQNTFIRNPCAHKA